MAEKPKLAMYWGSSCGGCEISVLNIHENILVVDEVFDIAFFPCIADFKISHVKGYDDGYIDVCLFNGAIRNSENEEMAKLLRQKSKIMVAYGSCAYEGCIPALSNLTTKEANPYDFSPPLTRPVKSAWMQGVRSREERGILEVRRNGGFVALPLLWQRTRQTGGFHRPGQSLCLLITLDAIA